MDVVIGEFFAGRRFFSNDVLTSFEEHFRKILRRILCSLSQIVEVRRNGGKLFSAQADSMVAWIDARRSEFMGSRCVGAVGSRISENPSSSLFGVELKEIYTGVTRPRDRLIIYEPYQSRETKVFHDLLYGAVARGIVPIRFHSEAGFGAGDDHPGAGAPEQGTSDQSTRTRGRSIARVLAHFDNDEIVREYFRGFHVDLADIVVEADAADKAGDFEKAANLFDVAGLHSEAALTRRKDYRRRGDIRGGADEAFRFAAAHFGYAAAEFWMLAGKDYLASALDMHKNESSQGAPSSSAFKYLDEILEHAQLAFRNALGELPASERKCVVQTGQEVLELRAQIWKDRALNREQRRLILERDGIDVLSKVSEFFRKAANEKRLNSLLEESQDRSLLASGPRTAGTAISDVAKQRANALLREAQSVFVEVAHQDHDPMCLRRALVDTFREKLPRDCVEILTQRRQIDLLRVAADEVRNRSGLPRHACSCVLQYLIAVNSARELYEAFSEQGSIKGMDIVEQMSPAEFFIAEWISKFDVYWEVFANRTQVFINEWKQTAQNVDAGLHSYQAERGRFLRFLSSSSFYGRADEFAAASSFLTMQPTARSVAKSTTNINFLRKQQLLLHFRLSVLFPPSTRPRPPVPPTPSRPRRSSSNPPLLTPPLHLLTPSSHFFST